MDESEDRWVAGMAEAKTSPKESYSSEILRLENVHAAPSRESTV